MKTHLTWLLMLVAAPAVAKVDRADQRLLLQPLQRPVDRRLAQVGVLGDRPAVDVLGADVAPGVAHNLQDREALGRDALLALAQEFDVGGGHVHILVAASSRRCTIPQLSLIRYTQFVPFTPRGAPMDAPGRRAHERVI